MRRPETTSRGRSPVPAEVQYNLGIDAGQEQQAGGGDGAFRGSVAVQAGICGCARNEISAWCSRAPRRVQEAIPHFETALRIDPNSVDAHVNLRGDRVIKDIRPKAGGYPAPQKRHRA